MSARQRQPRQWKTQRAPVAVVLAALAIELVHPTARAEVGSVASAASASGAAASSASADASASASASASAPIAVASASATTAICPPLPPALEVAPTSPTSDDSAAKLDIRYVIAQVRVRGNSRTRERVILRYIPFHAGDELEVDDIRLQLVRFRLLGTGYFSDARLSLVKGPRRGTVVLVVDVVERNTIVVNDLWLGVSADANSDGSARPLTAYGGADVAETNLFGTGISVGAALAVADQQEGYRLRFSDPSFLGGPYIVSFGLLYNNARDFFGTRDVEYDHNAIDPATGMPIAANADYAVATYTRKGGEAAFGLDLSPTTRLRAGYHLEWIDATLPAAASEVRGLDRVPIDFYLLQGRSILSMLQISLEDDTRDNPILPTRGHLFQLGGDFGVPVIGSDYSFLRAQLRYSDSVAVNRHGHVFSIDLFAGAIFGEAPLFMRFFVGDLSDFLPDRVLDLNFDRRPPPNFLHTMVQEERYEDFAARVTGEYRIPLYRGHRSIYGVDLFGSAGIYGLESTRDIQAPPRGYTGLQKLPVDLTFNVGFRVSTSSGGFLLAFSNAVGFFPIRSEAHP